MADNTEWTVSVPEAGKRYFGLGRNASYEAARRGDNPYAAGRNHAPRPGQGSGAHAGPGRGAFHEVMPSFSLARRSVRKMVLDAARRQRGQRRRV